MINRFYLVCILAKFKTDREIKKICNQLEEEERSRTEEANEESLRHYIKAAERAIAESKKVDSSDDLLYWYKVAKRYEIRARKTLHELQKIES